MRIAKSLTDSMEDVSEAVELVDDALKHEPIFSKSPFDLSKHELSDVNLIREDVEALEEEEDQTLEGCMKVYL